MGFFDNLGKRASDAYKVTADKTGKLAKEAKLRMKMNDLKANINEIYKEIGKAVYENHVEGKKEKLDKIFEEKCTQIDVISDEIKELEKECLELKDKIKCPKCFTEIDKDTKFCPNCGEELKTSKKEVKKDETKAKTTKSSGNTTKNSKTTNNTKGAKKTNSTKSTKSTKNTKK